MHYLSKLKLFVASDEKYTKLVKCDIEIGLPKNNNMQSKAIQIALRSSFSLIHGPPGESRHGKTMIFNLCFLALVEIIRTKYKMLGRIYNVCNMYLFLFFYTKRGINIYGCVVKY